MNIPATVPDITSGRVKMSFSGQDVPIRSVTVYKDRADITRTLTLSPSKIGLVEVIMLL